MRTILFVDDEEDILDALRRMLRPMRKEWEMNFVKSAQAGLAALAVQSADVVVSDMRMPGMDGAHFLEQVKRLYPHAVRIILSGHSDEEMILRSVGIAHQYLAKPCEASALKDTIARACALRDLLHDAALKQLIARMDSLPSLPSLYVEIIEQLQSPDASIKKIGEIISRDIAMTAKILQLVNSAFFGLPRRISDLPQAVSLIGIDIIKSLVCSLRLFSQFDEGLMAACRLNEVCDHSLRVGALARRIAFEAKADRHVADQSLLAGNLHDIGKLILAANHPESYRQCASLVREKGVAPLEAEAGVFGSTHGLVGAYLLGLWGLPDPIVEAVAYHHDPGHCPHQAFSPLTAVHVANALDSRVAPGGAQAGAPEIDMAYLSSMGLPMNAGDWLNRCRGLVVPGPGSPNRDA